MQNIIVAGCSTGVGKTVVSAILTTLIQGNYWKPVECGPEKDSEIMKGLINVSKHQVYSPIYSFLSALSPHAAAKLENRCIFIEELQVPLSKRPLVIETAGGIFTPLSDSILNLDYFSKLDASWIVVSKHYLGSINHTLLTHEVLRARGCLMLGLVFNGNDLASESVIQKNTKLPVLGRLYPEQKITFQTIQRYANTWKPFLP